MKPPRDPGAHLQGPALKVGSRGHVPRTPAGASASPAAPPWRPTTRSPTCTLPLRWFCCDVFYERADGMARARGKVLPWDKKLTLANSKFTACIFIFLIPAPSASNWGSTSLFSPFSPARSYLFIFIFRSRPSRLPPVGVGGFNPPAGVSRRHPAARGQGPPRLCFSGLLKE